MRELQYACAQLQFAKAFYDAGKLNEFIQATVSVLYEEEGFEFDFFWEMLAAMGDTFCEYEGYDGYSTHVYLSDRNIRTYFSFVREHARKEKISFKKDPYYLSAFEYFCNTMLDACPYNGQFNLVTQQHHEYGSGLSVVIYDDFAETTDLIFGLLEVLTYFKDCVEKLQAENKVTPSSIVIPYACQKQTEEVA